MGKSDVTKLKYAVELPAEYVEECHYIGMPDDGFLIQVEGADSYRGGTKASDLVREFRLLPLRDLDLRGFRAFSTQDGEFFLDEAYDRSWLQQRYAPRFNPGQAFEDYSAVFLDDGVEVVEPARWETVTEPVVALCSGEPSNYGSWLYRILPKLASLEADERALFVYCRSEWQRDFLRFFAPGRRIIEHKPALGYRLADAHVATMRNRYVYFDSRTREYYAEAADRVPGKSPLKKIYLSRLGQRIRPMTNEAEVEGLLRENGFAVVKPELLSLEDRIRVIRDAEEIVCPGGSGLFNLVFSGNARRVIDIEPSRTWVYAHHNLMRSLGLQHSILFGKQEAALGAHSPWMVDAGQLRLALS
jgi:hypothetical protein